MITKYDIAANVTIAGLENFTGRMTAAQQREVFGVNFFGRKSFTISTRNQGSANGHFSVCFGTDTVHFERSFEEIAEFASDPEKRVSW